MVIYNIWPKKQNNDMIWTLKKEPQWTEFGIDDESSFLWRILWHCRDNIEVISTDISLSNYKDRQISPISSLKSCLAFHTVPCSALYCCMNPNNFTVSQQMNAHDIVCIVVLYVRTPRNGALLAVTCLLPLLYQHSNSHHFLVHNILTFPL